MADKKENQEEKKQEAKKTNVEKNRPDDKKNGGREKKASKRKPKYGILSCVGYMYRLMWRHARPLVFVGCFTVPISLAMSALALYIPTITLRYLERSNRFSTVALVILGLGLAEFGLPWRRSVLR